MIETSIERDMITVLDIDVDLFVDPRPTGSAVRQGRRAEGVTAWNAKRVIDFMQCALSLNPERKIPGRTFETHEQTLHALAEIRSPVHLFHLAGC